jgi:hypothetical protein
MDLDLKGRIEQFTLTEIFQLIAAAGKSGTLGIESDDAIVMIYFHDGKIIYGYGPRQTFHLGQLLRDRGVLSEEQLEEAVRVQANSESSKRLGEIMVGRNLISRVDLETVVREQIEELLFTLMAWQSGSFKFYENQFPTEEEITVQISVENVILEGLRRIDEENMVNDTFPDLNDVFALSTSESTTPREISLEGQEWNVMSLVDGYRSIDEACKVSPYGRRETLKGLAKLKLAGLIAKAEPKQSADSTELEGMIGQLAGMFEEYLSAKPKSRLEPGTITQTYVEQSD